jgi:hypothetical protein
MWVSIEENFWLVWQIFLLGLGIGLSLFILAWFINWIFETILPKPFRAPVLLVTGVCLLIIGLLGLTSVLNKTSILHVVHKVLTRSPFS